MGEEYLICDIMTRKPIAVSEETSVYKITKELQKHDISSILVHEKVNPNVLVGIITLSDIVYKVIALAKDPKKILAEEIMSKEIISVKPNDEINVAINLINRYDIRRFPVIDEKGKLVGLVTLKDILRIEPEMIDKVYENLEVRELEDKIPGYKRKEYKTIFHGI
ncbi:MAG: CBS domain-containing protein [Candidatus Nanoarchaeia archaeon]|nr:CBS domain-containing protein [Candidatus Nanoarchaeia archaeon]